MNGKLNQYSQIVKPVTIGDATLLTGDVIDCLKTLTDDSVQCVVTSPPYWGLRDYGTATWEGGDPECDHAQEPPRFNGPKQTSAQVSGHASKAESHRRNNCPKCDAVRVDKGIGLEPTFQEWLARMVEVCREVRRVLRPDGTFWLNIGDAYNSNPAGPNPGGFQGKQMQENAGYSNAEPRHEKGTRASGLGKSKCLDLKPKDLMLMPARLAIALQEDGWWVRSDIIWSKPNPMPESVTDRPTSAHEYVFLLTKQARYFYDADAVREEPTQGSIERFGKNSRQSPSHKRGKGDGFTKPDEFFGTWPGSRNLRNVWTIATQPYPEAHFATFPEALPMKCIMAGTSEKGCCPECGKPWVRVVEPTEEYATKRTVFRVIQFDANAIGAYIAEGLAVKGMKQSDLAAHFPSRTGGMTGCVHNWVKGKNIPTAEQWRIIKDALRLDDRYDLLLDNPATGDAGSWGTGDLIQGNMKKAEALTKATKTIGWQPTCSCDAGDPVPCTVADIFGGSMTTGLVALKLGRRFIGIELNPDYMKLGIKRIESEARQEKLF